ncbi:MAG: NeuD/PglB/VioB family sugar acetyltransferase [Thermoguttaceae bacterium]
MSLRTRDATIVVLGAAGTGLSMAGTVKRTGSLRAAGFLDDDPAKQGRTFCGYPVLGGLAAWSALPEDWLFLSSLYGARKTPQFHNLVRSLGIPEERWAIVVDPRAVVGDEVLLGNGSFVGPGCVLEPMVRLGRWCALLGNVFLGHHTCLKEYVLCANSASLAGAVTVEDACFIGANATVREHARIGAGAVVGMGSVVLHDVGPGQIVAGNPARPLAAKQQGDER